METTKIRENSADDSAVAGAYLQERRLALGLEISDVVESLHIRRIHLQAIEDGRWDALPGSAYVPGFLRSYADFLGLDGHEFVNGLREAGLQGPAQEPLIPPTNLEEKRFPAGRTLLAAAFICSAAYAGWYLVSSEGHDAGQSVELAPPQTPPQRTASDTDTGSVDVAEADIRTGDQPTEAIETPLPEPVAVPDSEAADSNPATAPSQVPGSGNEDRPQVTEIAAPAPVDDVTQAAATGAAPRGSSEATMILASVSDEGSEQRNANGRADRSSAPSEEGTEVSSGTVSPPVVGSSGSAVAAPAPAEPAEEITPPGVAASGEPAETDTPPGGNVEVAGLQAVGSPPETGFDPETRVIIRATAPSWVLVSSPTKQVVYTRTMQPGETYILPDIRGMLLWTGNAGGLEVTVGARKIPPLGQPGGRHT